jgi:hypothetical protein
MEIMYVSQNPAYSTLKQIHIATTPENVQNMTKSIYQYAKAACGEYR